MVGYPEAECGFDIIQKTEDNENMLLFKNVSMMIGCAHPIAISRDDGSVVVTQKGVEDNNWIFVPCGHCEICVARQRAEWTGRLKAEALTHEHTLFATLTYSDQFLPQDKSLHYEDVQLFLKRLRKFVSPFRFFCAGEYGELRGRPHWHILLFGLDMSAKDAIIDSWKFHDYRAMMCADSEVGNKIVEEIDASDGRCAYTCGYVNKKLGEVDYSDRTPPMSRMSRRPGIGYDFCVSHESELRRDFGFRIGGKFYPMPRYFRKILDSDQFRKDFEAYANSEFNRKFIETNDRFSNPEACDITAVDILDEFEWSHFTWKIIKEWQSGRFQKEQDMKRLRELFHDARKNEKKKLMRVIA